MPRPCIESQYAEIVASGDYRMDADDLRAMDMDVVLLTSEMFDTLMEQWRSQGKAPLFPREDVE